jgi:hypothetical protein
MDFLALNTNPPSAAYTQAGAYHTILSPTIQDSHSHRPKILTVLDTITLSSSNAAYSARHPACFISLSPMHSPRHDPNAEHDRLFHVDCVLHLTYPCAMSVLLMFTWVDSRRCSTSRIFFFAHRRRRHLHKANSGELESAYFLTLAFLFFLSLLLPPFSVFLTSLWPTRCRPGRAS